MKEIEVVVARFPQHELTVHRLHGVDPDFRAACEDYREASIAARYWAVRQDVDRSRRDYYGGLVDELEREILAKIERAEEHAPGHRGRTGQDDET